MGTGGPDSLKNHKNIGFLSKTGPDPLKITKLQVSNVKPSSALQRNDDSIKHDIKCILKLKFSKIKISFALKFSDAVFIWLIHIKIPTLVGMLKRQ